MVASISAPLNSLANGLLPRPSAPLETQKEAARLPADRYSAGFAFVSGPDRSAAVRNPSQAAEIYRRQEALSLPVETPLQSLQKQQITGNPPSQSAAAIQPKNPAEPTAPDGGPLSQIEKQAIKQLQQANKNIRSHEQSHIVAAGGYARSGATFEYQKGPDGKTYAVHGEISIDTGKEAQPEDTIAKMRVVRKAALAPLAPSPQDMKIAAHATSSIEEAKHELRMIRLQEAKSAYDVNRKELDEVKNTIREETAEQMAVEDNIYQSSVDPPEINTEVEPPLKFTANSAKLYTVNTAQYQYAGLSIVV